MRRLGVPALMATVALAACDGPTATAPPITNAARFGGGADIVVVPGSSIQEAIDAASPGDRIFVRPGVYREALTIDRRNIQLVGLGRRLGSEGAARVVLENPGDAENGIHVTSEGDGVEIRNLTVRGFGENGVLLYGVDGFLLSEIVTQDNGEYGLFPVGSANGLIELSRASGHSDTGIYVGKSRNVTIRNTTAFGNVNGFEIENCSDISVLDNEAFGNTAGFLIVLLPGLPVKESSNILLARNVSRNNNLANFADGGFEQFVPAGSGILVVGTDQTTVQDNIVTGNDFVGIGVANSGLLAALAGVPVDDIDPFPDGTRVLANDVTGNGAGGSPLPFVPFGVDLLWDGTGTESCWSSNEFTTSLNLDLFGLFGGAGPALPACS